MIKIKELFELIDHKVPMEIKLGSAWINVTTEELEHTSYISLRDFCKEDALRIKLKDVLYEMSDGSGSFIYSSEEGNKHSSSWFKTGRSIRGFKICA